MKNLFLAVLLLSSAFITHADKFTGSWKEVRRSDVSGKAIPYTDTLRVQFKVGNEYLWMRPNAFQYRGTYTVSGNMLDLGIRTLQVITATKEKLVLKDEGGTYELARYEEGTMREDNTAAANGDRAKTSVEAIGIRNPAQLQGTWEVYKRTNSGAKEAIDYSRILRKLVIGSGGTNGSIFSAEDALNKPSWTIERVADNTIYCKGRDARMLKVLSAGNGELILQEGTVTYFFKQFKG